MGPSEEKRYPVNLAEQVESVWLKPRSISYFFTFPYYTSSKHWHCNLNTTRWKHARSHFVVVNVFGLYIQQWLLRVNHREGALKWNRISVTLNTFFTDFIRDCNKNRAQNVHATLLHYRCSTNPEFTRFKEIIHNFILHNYKKSLHRCYSTAIANDWLLCCLTLNRSEQMWFCKNTKQKGFKNWADNSMLQNE